MLRYSILSLAICLSSCAVIGDKTVYEARPAYNEAIARTSSEQLLLNLVRMKYRDPPVFLQVGSIATQYIFTGTAGVNPTIQSNDTTVLGTLGVQHVEQPTITYTPLQGEQFARQLMSNISIDTLALLASSGWSIERIFRCCVQSINSVQNAPSAAGPTPDHAPDFRNFYRLSQLFRKLQEKGGLRFEPKTSSSGPMLHLDTGHNDDPQIIKEMDSLLGISGTQVSYSLTKKGSDAGGPSSLVIIPRSLYATLFYLSQGVVVPRENIDAGLVTKTIDDAGVEFDWSEVTKNLIVIKSSKTLPNAAYLSIPYRGYYFYIEDNDLSSKATMMLLDQLFSLQSGGGGTTAAPALTLNVGH